MKIKSDKTDVLFSRMVRLRDKKCVRCGSAVRLNEKGDPVSHQCSHYWSRRHESTRFDFDNADTLCCPCHFLWGGDRREEYTDFKKKQLGEKFKELERRHNQIVKKDRKGIFFILSKSYNLAKNESTKKDN